MIHAEVIVELGIVDARGVGAVRGEAGTEGDVLQENRDREVVERHAGVEILLRPSAAEAAGDEVELDLILSHIGRCRQRQEQEEGVAQIEPHAERAVHVDQHQGG